MKKNENEKNGMGLSSAFRGITGIRVCGREGRNMASAAYWYTFVGLVLGTLVLVIPLTVSFCFTGKFASADTITALLWGSLTVSFLAFLTRSFHLDGLADTLDGFGGGYTKERRMEIMKDSRLGSFGATGLVCTLAIKIIAFSVLYLYNPFLIILCIVSGRFSLTLLCRISNYAKETGLAKQLVDQVKVSHILFNLLFFLPFYKIWGSVFVSLGVTVIVSLFTKRYSFKRIGGITGDLLGFNTELSETITALTLAIICLYNIL